MLKKCTVLVSGHFNVLHPGHLRLLRFAKECGNKLIVAVESDRIAGNNAHVHENLRLENIKICSLIDDAFISDEPIEEIIKRLRPDIVVKGKEHELKKNPELEAVELYGGRLVFTSGETIFSSIDLINKEFQSYDSRTINHPQHYLERHHIDKQRLIKLLESYKKLKICVIGDLIIDEYITCQPLGMSREDTTIAVTPLNSHCFLGGAGIVAAHAASFGASVEFLSVTGKDAMRDFALEKLSISNIHAQLLVDDSRPTTLKQRYRSQGKNLLRVSHLHQTGISLDLQKKMIAFIKETINDADLLVFSDFNYGCLPQALVDQVIAIAKNLDILMVADSQSSSQLGNVARFKGMDLLTPTEYEARISLRNQEDGLVILAEKLKQQSEARNIFIKLGEEGLLIYPENISEDRLLTDRMEAMNTAPKDVAGAGDALLISSAMTLAVGGTIWEAGYLGSLAAAVQVGRVGNIPISISEILKELI